MGASHPGGRPVSRRGDEPAMSCRWSNLGILPLLRNIDPTRPLDSRKETPTELASYRDPTETPTKASMEAPVDRPSDCSKDCPEGMTATTTPTSTSPNLQFPCPDGWRLQPQDSHEESHKDSRKEKAPPLQGPRSINGCSNPYRLPNVASNEISPIFGLGFFSKNHEYTRP